MACVRNHDLMSPLTTVRVILIVSLAAAIGCTSTARRDSQFDEALDRQAIVRVMTAAADWQLRTHRSILAMTGRRRRSGRASLRLRRCRAIRSAISAKCGAMAKRTAGVRDRVRFHRMGEDAVPVDLVRRIVHVAAGSGHGHASYGRPTIPRFHEPHVVENHRLPLRQERAPVLPR